MQDRRETNIEQVQAQLDYMMVSVHVCAHVRTYTDSDLADTFE
jgi:hypothetical protein